MKKFENVSEYEILSVAWLHYLELYQKESEIFKKNPSDKIAEFRKDKYKKISDELHDACLDLEVSK